MNLAQLRITAFMMSVSTVLVGIALGVLLARGEDIYESVAFCVILLVASIPIAMPLVSVVTMSLGSRKLSEQTRQDKTRQVKTGETYDKAS